MNATISAVGDPQHVRAAPSHPDPYPYYGRLTRERPFFRDDVNGWWVATSAAAVTEVLTSGVCLTRPLIEPISEALHSGAAAEIFGRLVRLRDDEERAKLKEAVTNALRGVDLRQVAKLARMRAAALDNEIGRPLDEAKIMQFMFAMPVQVLAHLLGVPREHFGDGSAIMAPPPRPRELEFLRPRLICSHAAITAHGRCSIS